MAIKGNIPWNKGRKETRPEVLNRISNSQKGKRPWNKGLTKSDSRVAKYSQGTSERMKGRKAWNKGLKGVQPWSEESKEKVREFAIKNNIGNRLPHGKAEKSTNWKGGTSIKKEEAKIRDNYICQICGLYEPLIMVVDHIRPQVIRPDLKYVLDNLMTLCPNCHARKTIVDIKLIKEFRKNKHE